MKVSKTSIQGAAVVATFSYQSYSTLAYGLLGDSSILRAVLIGITVMVCGIGIVLSRKSTLIFAIKLVLGYIMLFGLYGVLFPTNIPYILEIISSSFIWLFVVILMREIDFNTIRCCILRSGYLILFCNAFEPLHRYVTSQHIGHMVYGMRVLTCVIIFLYFFFERKKMKYACCAVIGALLIFSFGNRSALLVCIVITVVGILELQKKSVSKVVIVAGLLTAVALVYILRNQLIDIVGTILQKLNISSRTFMKLLEGSISDGTGREIIWNNAYHYICENWLLGYGIGGDRAIVLIGNSNGYYVHNFILELLLDFGVIGGTFACAWIGWMSYKMLCHSRSKHISRMFKYVLIATAIKLFYSSSIWMDFNTYWLIGIVVCNREYNRRLKRLRVQEPAEGVHYE